MTITRRTFASVVLVAGTLLLLGWAGHAAAGGFSTTTLDPLTAQPRAGQTVEIGYTIRGHGVTPITVDDTAIAITGPDGARTEFPGRPSGPVGHHVAQVRFPEAGTWGWEQLQDGFTMQDLGSVRVAPADAAAVAPAAERRGPGAVALGLLAATAVAAALLVTVALRPPRDRRPA